VPSYNSADFLPTLFDSLLAQSYSNVELIFSDDASLDNSFEIAQRYRPQLEEKFTCVKFIQQSQNRGGLLNLADSFKEARGELIGYLDADDYYAPDKLRANVEFFAEHPECGAVHSGYQAIVNGYTCEQQFFEKHFIHFCTVIPRGWIYEDLLRANFICSATMLVRREYFERAYDFETFRRRDYGMGDYPAYLNLSRITEIGYIDRTLAYYRVRQESMSHTQSPQRRASMYRSIARVQQDCRIGLLNPLPAGASCLVPTR
jgi:glycosyltransferase involved in cell wall biosynthesis